MKKPLVEIQWIDVETHGGWHDDEDDDFSLMKTYGVLVRTTEERITLASGFDAENGKWSDKMYFPRGVVKNIRIIEEVEVDI